MADKTFSPASGPDRTPQYDDGPAGEARQTFPASADQLYRDLFTSFDLLPLIVFEEAGRFVPGVTVMHRPDAVVITADLPGVRAEDLEISLTPDVLVISDRRSRAPGGSVPVSESFRKTVPVPFRVDPQGIEATFENGILRIILPRCPDEATERLRVPVRHG